MKCVLLLVVVCYFHVFTVWGQGVQPLEDQEFWYNEGKERLSMMLEKKRNYNVAQNVIIFIGDGMGLPTITATRIFRDQQQGYTGEEGYLSFDEFPDVGLIKTYNVDKQVPDSAGTATAIFTGVKTNYKQIGVDATIKAGNCDAGLLESSKVSSILSWAQEKGKHTGIVTTTRITHATPASSYAHVTDRDWECDSEIPPQCTHVKDIARQLVEDEPGRKLKVIFGGGLHQLGVEVSPNESSCTRKDGRNLANEWLAEKEEMGVQAKFIRTTDELMSIKPGDDEFVLGLFGYGHMDYDAERNRDPASGTPSLVNMTVQAIKMLQQSENGFVLIVEGGRIDHAHHDNYAQLSLLEAVQLDAAVSAALELTSRDNTLIIVTADHSHSMTLNGYPERGNDILGFAHNEVDHPVYETLTYANGPGFTYHRNESDNEYLWRDLSKDETRNDLRYQHFAPIYESSETHGGEDVAVYAIGPYSHLFNGVHEQSYIAHAISCAGMFGPDKDVCISAAHSLQTGSLGAFLLALTLALRNLF